MAPIAFHAPTGIGTGILALAVAAAPANAQDVYTAPLAPAAATAADSACDYDTLASHSTVVTEWNAVALRAVCLDKPWPTVVSRSLFVVHASIYDSWAAQVAGARTYAFEGSAPSLGDADLHEAISHAAHLALCHEFPELTALFDAHLAALGHEKGADTAGAHHGRAAARAVLAGREGDGSRAASGFLPSIAHEAANAPDAPLAMLDPNRWQPLIVPTGSLIDDKAGGAPTIDLDDPGSYAVQQFITPHWGEVRPFALSSGDVLRPPAPPMHGSQEPYVDALGRRSTSHQAWLDQTEAVMRAQAALTDRGKVIAEYWADGPRSATPPGHWNLFAQMVSLRDDHDAADDARLFLALNAAMMDAAIATWDAKAAYDYVRPATAVRFLYRGQTIQGWRGPDLGTGPMPGEAWRPYQDPTFVTPAFAEYPSGHSTFSAAGAEVLLRFTGSDAFHDAGTIVGDVDDDGRLEAMGLHRVHPEGGLFERGMPTETVELRWNTFSDAADEAGYSRIHGGIHFQDGDLRGRTLGRQIGTLAFERARRMWGAMHGEPRRKGTDVASRAAPGQVGP